MTGLIVEDNASAREGLSQLLTTAGFSVATASNGEQARSKLDEQRFDVMLLDIWMPHMTGLGPTQRRRC